MKRAMTKTTLRGIKNSLGRYLAIFAIVALGVGVFAGLLATKPAMIASEETYLQDKNFFDYRLLSTLGFTEENVEEAAKIAGVRQAEGSISVDALCLLGEETESVYKIHMMPEQINQIELVSGRMPQNGRECVADSNWFTEGDLGTQITITDNNDEDTLDMFAERTCTVVGTVRSSYYINFERGTTSIGDGKVSAFLYFPKEAFDCDYYTEIFLTMQETYPVYSDEYADYLDATEDEVEDAVDAMVWSRYDEIMEEAQEKIDDAQKELDDKSAEAEQELGDALQELKDGEEEIATHEQEIEDGREEIARAKDELSRQERALDENERALQESEDALQANAAQLELAGAMMPPEQYAYGMAELEAGRQQIAAGREQIAEGRKQIASARNEIAEQEKELEEGAQELEDARQEIADGYEEYEDAKKEFEEEVADAQIKIDDAREELADIEEPDSYVLTRETNIGYVCFDSDSSIVAGVARVFPVFFFLVAALVCMTTMNRMVEEQRTQIGVMKALGYGKGAIMGKFIFYSGSAAIMGCVFGFALGTFALPKIIWYAYKMMYNMGEITYVFAGGLAAVSMLASLVCSVGATYFSCRHELESVPANLIRPKSPKSGKRILLERITFIWSRLKFLRKVSIRNIFRYKRRFFMMILGIGGCTALLVTGFGVKDSVVNVAEQQYGEVEIYDIGFTFSDSMDEERAARFEEKMDGRLADIAYHYNGSVDVNFGGKVKSVYLEIPQDVEATKRFLKLHTADGEEIAYPEKGEAVITSAAAEQLGIKVGSRLVLRDYDMNEITVTVTALSENFVYNYIYICKETYEEQLGEEPEYTSAYAKAAEGVDHHEAGALAADCKEVMSVMVVQDMRDRIAAMMGSMDLIVLVIIVCAGALAFIVLYNLTNINITERLREIATIKVLGFYPAETAAYVFRENMMLTAIGALIGLVLGRLLHIFVMTQIKVDMISFKPYIRPIGYLYSFVLTFVFAMVVNGLMYFKLEKINMAESLKSIE